MQFKQYPSYKNSGVEWLGHVPEHWNTKPTKYCFKLITDKAIENNSEVLLSVYTDIGVKPRSELEERGNKASTTDGYWIVKKGDIIVNKLLAWMGAIGLSNYSGVTSPAYDILRIKYNYTPEYYNYLFRNGDMFTEFKRYSRGLMDMRLRLYFSEFGNIKLPVPSIDEQQKIVSFLDIETARIDNLIAKQEKLIELLEEQRKSIISHAVTKGLNPNAPMKDSGVEWLGEVPEHWMTPSSKHLLEIPITDGPHETPNFVDDGVPFISAEAISKGKIDFDKKRGYITPELNAIYSKKYSPKIEDIYMVKSGATTGKVAMVETTEEFNIWSPLAVFRCNKNKVLPKFLLAVFNSSHFYDALVLNWSYGTQQNIGMGVLSNIEIPCPPLKEQAEIIQHLDAQNTKFDKLISTQSQLIEKLKEYRSSIISHAVTGKIDVREFVA